MADLGPAQHQLDVRPQRLEQPHHLRRLDHVPDVNAQADDAGVERQQVLHDLRGPLPDDELAQGRLRPQARATMPVHVGQQAAQTERGVNELGVERGQHDGRGRRHARWSGWGRRVEALHAGIIEARATAPKQKDSSSARAQGLCFGGGEDRDLKFPIYKDHRMCIPGIHNISPCNLTSFQCSNRAFTYRR